jgi:hypothetical protein
MRRLGFAMVFVMGGAAAAIGMGACGSVEPTARTLVVESPPPNLSLPRAPGKFSPSLVAVAGDGKVDGLELADIDTCATCHPAAAQQWSQSAHSFASFGNPIYRANIELFRSMLGKKNSQHCGGCHDMPLVVDGTMLTEIPSDDIRAHNGVTCRLCHGIDKVTLDGNGSYVFDPTPLPTPTMGDVASIDAHKAAVTLKPLGTEVCMGCHRGFLSPDMDMPIHMSGLDETGVWRGSPWNGNGTGRIDKVEKKDCIDCHMKREAAGPDEVAAKDGTIASHRFLGGHTWMASMRDDKDQLAKLQEMLVGAASIDVAGVRKHERSGDTWYLPADGAPVTPGTHLDFDVVIRNLSTGHRFPGGVNDMQDTWIEVEITDAKGVRLASSGLSHATDHADKETHVLRSLPVDDEANILDEHEMPKFRSVIAIHTLAPREAQVIRYALAVPKDLAADRLPLTVTARMRHRSRSLHQQDVVCAEARTKEGEAFLRGVEDTRYVLLDPCAPQPITEVASTQVKVGDTGPVSATSRAAWERMYEHGMALTAVIGERLDESKTVLEHALAAVPAGETKPAAMIKTQLAIVASKQGRADDAMALLDEVEELLGPGPLPPVVPTVRADALARVWRWNEAIAPAKLAAERAPLNVGSWIMLARVLASVGDDEGALEAAKKGLVLSPRDPDLLRTQAVCARTLESKDADAALEAFDRFRSPDAAAEHRITCARNSPRCQREREMGHTHTLTLAK